MLQVSLCEAMFVTCVITRNSVCHMCNYVRVSVKCHYVRQCLSNVSLCESVCQMSLCETVSVKCVLCDTVYVKYMSLCQAMYVTM